ncbi:SGNH hydrolase-type esterase domain-containing protein [Aspergillus ambiguus]|uniref:SGNH/GDSL hydrolase family protein n=1 Tax=Aspergillus ambiguus TaxID=176160 RepID=UPI003CCDBB78
MPQLVEPYNLPPAPYNATDSVFKNTTIRQTFRITQSADQIRLRVSNTFGVNDLRVTKVSIALPVGDELGTRAIQENTTKNVLFSGNPDITIPNGALVVSDTINLPVKGLQTIAVDIYLEQGQEGSAVTGHPGSRTTSWMSFGNWVGAANMTEASAMSTDHWYFISGVEAVEPARTHSCAIVGDSITDGRGSTTNQNNRWPDLLLKRMQKNPATRSIALLNQAAGGNRILADGLGPNTLSRIDRDVLAQTDVKYAILYEGVNDIGVADPTPEAQKDIGDRLIVAYQQIVTRIHASGIPVYGATITPFSAPEADSDIQPYSNPEREKTRQRINKWIRTSGVFDAVLDFDKVVRDPEIPSQLAPKYDSGDYLHPNVAGYQAIADYFPLDLF